MPGEARTRIAEGPVGSNQLSLLLTGIFFFLKSWHLVKNMAGTSVLLLIAHSSISRFDREDAHLILKTTAPFFGFFFFLYFQHPLAELESQNLQPGDNSARNAPKVNLAALPNVK